MGSTGSKLWLGLQNTFYLWIPKFTTFLCQRRAAKTFALGYYRSNSSAISIHWLKHLHHTDLAKDSLWKNEYAAKNSNCCRIRFERVSCYICLPPDSSATIVYQSLSTTDSSWRTRLLLKRQVYAPQWRRRVCCKQPTALTVYWLHSDWLRHDCPLPGNLRTKNPC